METKFTNEEIWKSYSSAIIHYMIEHFNVSREESLKRIDEKGLKDDFLNNMDNYEFIEPYRLARDLSAVKIKEFYSYGNMIDYLKGKRNIKEASFSYDEKNDIYVLTVTELIK